MQTTEPAKTTPTVQAKATQEKPFFAPAGRQTAGGKAFFNSSEGSGNGFFRPGAQPAVQAKLTIGAPGDKYEQEADRMAERVVSQPAVQRQELPEEEEKINRKPLAAEISPKVQRQAEAEMKIASLQKKSHWSRLPGYAQTDIKLAKYDKSDLTGFSGESDQERYDALNSASQLRLINVYVKMKARGLWRFVNEIKRINEEGVEFAATDTNALKTALEMLRLPNFRSVWFKRQTADQWDLSEVSRGSLHFKYNTAWWKNRVQVHIDEVGWAKNIFDHLLTKKSYRDPYRIRDILTEEGYYKQKKPSNTIQPKNISQTSGNQDRIFRWMTDDAMKDGEKKYKAGKIEGVIKKNDTHEVLTKQVLKNINNNRKVFGGESVNKIVKGSGEPDRWKGFNVYFLAKIYPEIEKIDQNKPSRLNKYWEKIKVLFGKDKSKIEKILHAWGGEQESIVGLKKQDDFNWMLSGKGAIGILIDEAIRNYESKGSKGNGLALLGISLHTIQDFYAHNVPLAEREEAKKMKMDYSVLEDDPAIGPWRWKEAQKNTLNQLNEFYKRLPSEKQQELATN